MERNESKGGGMGPVVVFFVLWTILLILLGGLEVHADELSPSLRVQWTELEPPTSLTDRCRRVQLAKKGTYNVEIQSPALTSGLWIENDTVDAHIVSRTVGIRFQVCRPGYVTVCETTPSALGPVDFSVDEEEDPLEVVVDEDPIRIELCDPFADLLETQVDIDP